MTGRRPERPGRFFIKRSASQKFGHIFTMFFMKTHVISSDVQDMHKSLHGEMFPQILNKSNYNLNHC